MFDRTRVYTALNADELKSGDKVIVANTLGELKKCVECPEKPKTLCRVLGEDKHGRFNVDVWSSEGFELAYLVKKGE